MSTSISSSSKKKNIFRIGALAAIAGLLFGIDTGIMSGALPFLQKDFLLNDTLSGRVVGALMFGGAIGALFAGWLSWFIGRKFSMMISAVLFVIGAIVCATAPNVFILISGRILLGLAIGIASFATPLYLAEIAPEKIRGSMISFYQMLITLGILTSFFIDTAFSYSGAWRIMLGITAIPAFIFFIGVFFLPKSPRWLASKNKDEEAKRILKNIRNNDDDIKQEFSEIKESLQIKQNGWNLFKNNKNFRRSVGLGAMLQIMQQLTGINIILYYAPKIMQLAGFASTTQQMWATVVIGLVNVIFTFVAIKIIDQWGRRPILIMGFIFMSLGMFLLSLNFYFNSEHPMAHYFSVFVILTFIAGFAMSAGPLVWTLCSEIQPLNGRDFGITVSTAANWFSNMLLSAVFLIFLTKVGPTNAFLIFAILNFIFIFVTFFFVPETKNISLEKIEKNLMSGKKLRNIGQKIS